MKCFKLGLAFIHEATPFIFGMSHGRKNVGTKGASCRASRALIHPDDARYSSSPVAGSPAA